MHRLLKRQLKRSFGQDYEIPEQWRPPVEAVDEGYRQYDSDLTQIERSLDLSSGELMEANAEMRAVLQALPNIFLRLGKDGVILDCRTTEDSGVFRMWKALIGGPLAGALSPGLGAQFEAAMKRARAAQAMERFEYSLIVDGNRKFFEARVVPMPGGDTTAIMRDMTDQRLAEERRNAAAESLKQTNETLREKLSEIEKLNENLTAIQNQLLQSQEVMQHQKLESIGQLAGGVAHDLNNILQVISGHVEMALASERLDAELTDDLSRISNAAERATALIKQLLAFGKKQFLHRKNINLNKNLTDLVGLLRRIIKANVEIEFHVETETDLVSADPMVLDQVLMNLCINARDAMPGGGKLTIRTSNVVEYGKTFLLISVTDTGAGIPPENIDRIFEPFFTTKENLKGTGLGLAVAYGAIAQHKGRIKAEPGPGGKGATFKVWLPVVEENEASQPKKLERSHPDLRQKGTILLAEDEPGVREVAVRILERAGFQVLCASNGMEAVAIFKAHLGKIDLVLLDVIMPKMGGRAAFESITKLKPEVPVLFCSGYGDMDLDFIGLQGLTLIAKPYGSSELLQSVHQALGGEAGC